MKPSMAVHRGYFFVVLLFTAWVGFFGFFRPQEILRALPWPVPPLHARFIGALYLAATVFLCLAMLARTRLQVRTIVDIAFVWTGWLLLVSLIHWGSFDFGREQAWFWWVAYIAFPVMAAWLIWARPPCVTSEFSSEFSSDLSSANLAVSLPRQASMTQRWAPILLRVQGLLLVTLAAALMLVPSWVVGLWPWKISSFLAQVYSGPVLGLGVGSLLLAARRNWPETLIPSVGMLVFAVLALIGSAQHLGLFVRGSASQIIWFGSLFVLAMGSLFISVIAWQYRAVNGLGTATGEHS